MIIPGTAKGVVESLRNQYRFSVKMIAQTVGVNPKTIYEILKGNPTHPDTDFELLLLYLKLNDLSNKKNPNL